MKILYVTPNVPQFPGTGGEVREFYLLRNLAVRHEFHVVCPARRREVEARRHLAEFCRVQALPLHEDGRAAFLGRVGRRLRVGVSSTRMAAVRVVRPAEYVRYQAFNRSCRRVFGSSNGCADFDVVEFQHSHIYPSVVRFLGRLPVVATLHNVNAVAVQRAVGISRHPWNGHAHVRFWRKLETTILKTADLVVTMSDLESERCRNLCLPARLRAVPCGTDPVHFRPSHGQRKKAELLFCGLMNYRPNIDAARFLATEIFPLVRQVVPSCRLQIVGKDPASAVRALAGDGAEVTGWVDSVVPFLQLCSVFVAPIRLGGGMRLKILDALACAAPVVATSFACDGIGLTDGREALVRDDPRSFADAVLYLLGHPRESEKMGVRGRTFVETRYDWRILAQGMDQAYDEAVTHFRSAAMVVTTNPLSPLRS